MKEEKLEVLLLINNGSYYPPSSAESLSNITLKFIPENTT